MDSHAAAIASALSSSTLRVLAHTFFRWIPGHQLVPIIYTLGLIYITSFLYAWKLAQDENNEKAQRNGKLVTRAKARERKKSTESKRAPSVLEVTIRGHTYKYTPHLDVSTLRALSTMTLGWPNITSLPWSIATALTNVLLVLGVLDVVYRGRVFYPSRDVAFTRVGYVSDTSAKILVREPDMSHLPIYISYRGAPGSGVDESWKSAGHVYLLSNETDYTYSQTITHLQPSTRYQYAVSDDQTGFFTTGAASPGKLESGSSKFTFLTSSCIKPRFPYNPFAHPLSIPGLKHLTKWIPELQASFMLFLGDFIYVDVPHRHGYNAETYRREYRQVYASPDWPAATKELPWLHVIDDHEIANDWDKQWQNPYPAAIDPWNIYHASLNPPPVRPDASYFQFTQGLASFFMMDTRSYRDGETSSNATTPGKTMLGAAQLGSLLQFLKRDEPAGVHWKFVISSIPFTRNWRLNAKDTWGNYLYERRIILEAMWDVGMRGDGVGVVVLSGDRHEFAATAFPPPKDSKWPVSATVHEFSTSPLSMFYLPIRSYWEKPGEDDVDEVCIKYAPDGNSKFGALEMEEVKGGEQGLLRFRLFVDGKETWNYVLMTPPAVGGGGRGKDAIWG